MRYLLLFLLCLSAAAVEDVTQTITVTTPTKAFSLLDENFDRGDSAWRIVRTFQADQSSDDPKALRTAPQGLFPFPYTQAFIDHQATLTRPLISVQKLRFVFTLGTVSIESRNPPGSRLYTYTRPTPNFVGSESIVYTYIDAGADFLDTSDDVELLRVTCVFVSPNTPPSIALSASPSTAFVNDTVSLPSVTSDPDGQALTVSYDYGDGLTGSVPVHAYSTPGTYSITATVSDGHGGTASASALVTIVQRPPDPAVLDPLTNTPTARFATSDVVGFVDLPLVFDATTSTDPQNNIAGYTWNFGDGSPLANGPIVSKIFSASQTFTVSLTVTDFDGFSATITREIEILPAEQSGTFDAELTFTTRCSRTLSNRDTLSAFVRVNIGDNRPAAGDSVSLSLCDREFTGVLDKRLRSSAAGVVFKLKQSRQQTPGTIEMQFKARGADGLAAAIVAAVGSDSVDETPVSVRVQISGRSFSLNVLSDFDITASKIKGQGEF